MKKSTIQAFLVTSILLFISFSVHAQQNSLGVGAIIGTPNGLSVKGWIGENAAVDGALSFTLGENTSSVYLHSDVLIHKSLDDEGVDVESGSLQFYYGAGIRLQWFEVIDEVYTGIRGPAGITYQIEESPAELFFELVPTIDINPAFRFSFGGGIGARYYLKD